MTDPSRQEAAAQPADRDIFLMNRVREGDTEAFTELIETHRVRVVGTISKMLGDDIDAQDLAQQVFIRIWKSAGRYKPTAKFTTWMFTITRNLVFNEVRRRARHPSVPLEREVEEHAFQAPDTRTSTPDDAMLETELQDAIQSAIESLPEAQRMAIIMRRYEALPYEDIGEILGLSVPAVKSVLFRARTELREQLRRYLDAE